MEAPELKFSEWLIKRNKVKVRDIKQSNPPWLWRKLKKIGAIALKGKYVYVRDLSDKSEGRLWTILVHEVCGHIIKQRRTTWSLYLIRYALSQWFRVKDEVNAYTLSMEALYIRGADITNAPAQIAKKLDENYLINNRRTKWAKKKLTTNMQKILSGEIHTVKTLMSQWGGR